MNTLTKTMSNYIFFNSINYTEQHTKNGTTKASIKRFMMKKKFRRHHLTTPLEMADILNSRCKSLVNPPIAAQFQGAISQ